MHILKRQKFLTQPPPVFEHPNEDNGGVILAVTVTFTAFALLAVMLRMYVRTFMLKTVGSDDYVMIAAMVCSLGVIACVIGEVNLGVGHHLGFPKLMANQMIIAHYSWFHAWINVLGTSLVKVSIGLFLLRLVQGKWYKRILIGWIIFTILFTISSMGTLLFQCLPVNAAWDFPLRADPNTKCYSLSIYRSIGLFNGAINIFTDFFFATLPIPLILPLQINLRTKISLMCILGLGYFACAAAIMREHLLAKFFDEVDPFYDYSLQVWNGIEINVGILAACLPSLRPLFASILETANTLKLSGLRGNKKGSGGTPQGRYYLQQDEIKMSPVARSGTALGNKGYKITVIGGGGKSTTEETDLYRNSSLASSGPRSKLEQSITENDSGSEDNIMVPMPLPLQGRDNLYMTREREGDRDRAERPREQPNGILRTTEVSISRRD
ncbi:uncharacterized protein RSE6_12363 [Rhynchosporium secalis]|uniref:Rhodopsin domain-containing protein n=1 Tax=Rhynchosporium secalis TaxID=38038 RepID=A0A1E1MQ84_RHYSE|nr:uncharacterized protein RSE6_12363 [Rhynchosporium secalis]